MATLKPIRGLRYAPEVVGSMADVVAPPYDVINPASRERLYERSPHNVVRLILNREADPYQAAAATLADWRARAVLRFDETPALYLYAQRFTLPDGSARERTGLIGGLRLETFESGGVRPHERTLAKAKSDRLALVRACRTSLSPIFGLVAQPGWSFATLVPEQAPEVEVTDDVGIRHRLWRIADPAVAAAVAARIGPESVFIADGHHRYETALRYRDESRAEAGADAPAPGAAAYDYVLAYLTTMDDPGLVVLPTHRVLATLPMSAATLHAALSARFTLTEIPWTDAGVTDLMARLDGPRNGAVRIGVAVAGQSALWHVTAPLNAIGLPEDLPEVLGRLEVSALHRVVLGEMLGLPVGDHAGAPGLSYAKEAGAAFAAVREGAAGAAFLLPATDVEDLRAVSLAGLTMPEKSTFFYPKLLTGLVLYPLA